MCFQQAEEPKFQCTECWMIFPTAPAHDHAKETSHKIKRIDDNPLLDKPAPTG